MAARCPRVAASILPVGDAVHLREVDRERRALARSAPHVHRATVLGDDAVDDREAEAGALPGLLGSEERLEDPLDGRRVHAGTGVPGLRGGCSDPRTGRRATTSARPLALQAVERHLELAVAGHRVRGVRAKVHHHLLQLSRRRRSSKRPRAQPGEHRQRCRERAAKQLGRLRNRWVRPASAGTAARDGGRRRAPGRRPPALARRP